MDATLDWLDESSEEVVWADTPHPYSLVPAFVVGIPLSLVLVGIPIVVGAYLAHRNTHYVVTSGALYEKTGVLSRSVHRIEFGKVQDTSYRQSFLGARFGYGTVDVSTAGGSGVEMSFQNVTDPRRVQSLVNERLGDRGGRGEGRDPADVLDDVLVELRAIRRAVGGGAGDSPVAGSERGTGGESGGRETDSATDPSGGS